MYQAKLNLVYYSDKFWTIYLKGKHNSLETYAKTSYTYFFVNPNI